jgi:hypothetical protein
MEKFDPVFLINVIGIFLAFGLVIRLYLWPRLRALPTDQALKILIVPHTFRFIGLSVLYTGVVSPELPTKFRYPAAWGDFGAAMLALVAILAIHRRWSVALPLVWIFNLWGSINLLYAYYNGGVLHIKGGSFGAFYYIPTLYVPLLLITHGLIFYLLIARPKHAAEEPSIEKFRASS